MFGLSALFFPLSHVVKAVKQVACRFAIPASRMIFQAKEPADFLGKKILPPPETEPFSVVLWPRWLKIGSIPAG
ncbi:MAG TPA: hypothetical protein VL527_09520 [Dongiaceae bacterium]|nr:hypothetical protein [Dongiaceae bacterium]